jgi:hypothetical protein
MTPLVNPMKPARVTGKLATTMVECLYLEKKVLWAKVLEEVIAQQVKLMGLKNLNVCLFGYLAPIYSAKNIFNRKEAQDYRFTKEGGDPEAEKADKEGFEAEIESDPDSDLEPTPDTSGEWQEQQPGPPSENKTQSREERTGNPPQEGREVENQAGSEEKLQEANLSQGPTHSSPGQPAVGQEAQGEYTPDPNLGLARDWHRLQAWGAFENYPGPDMAQLQQAGLISSWVGSLQQDLIWRDQGWERIGKLLNCSPNLISTGVMQLVQERESLANQIQELEEKKFSLKKDCEEAERNVVCLRSDVKLLGLEVDSVKREHDELQDLSQQKQEEKEQLAKQLKEARVTLALEEGIQRSLVVAAVAAKMILEVDKEQIIQKQLEHLYKGEAQSFLRLYKSMQKFSNNIMQVQEGLEGELKLIRNYLQEKHRRAVE